MKFNLKNLALVIPVFFVACGAANTANDPRGNGNDGPIDGIWSRDNTLCTTGNYRANTAKSAIKIDNDKGEIQVKNGNGYYIIPVSISYDTAKKVATFTPGASSANTQVPAGFTLPNNSNTSFTATYSLTGSDKITLNISSDLLCSGGLAGDLSSTASATNTPSFDITK